MQDLFCILSIGGIIGAGIFSMVGTGIATTGRSVALALIVGMIFTMSQQIRYIFTASMFQLSGGMYSQNALVLSPLPGGCQRRCNPGILGELFGIRHLDGPVPR